MIEVIDSRGRTLTPCRRKVAEREVRLNRAKWIGRNKIRLRFDPFAYRYIRLKVLERDQYTCYWCGGPGATIDHVIPWSQGGRNTMENCVCACEVCNGERGDMPAEEFARKRNVLPPTPEMLRRKQALMRSGGPAVALVPEAAVTAGNLATAVRPQEQTAPESAPAARSWAVRDLVDPFGRLVSRRLFY